LLAELSIQALLEKTAGAAPVPGGGSMSALSGAVAASLTEMVANLTIGKKNYEAASEEMQVIAAKAAAARKKMTAAIDRDADAYQQVVAAFKLARATDEEKSARKKAIQDALKKAALTPLEAAGDALSIMELAGRALAKGNKNAYSDAAVAVMHARTAALGAIYNVKINLADIKDAPFVAETGRKADAIEEKVRQLEEALLAGNR
jgi:formiminotetrahydrofolate cyclodeaminase